MIPQDVRAEFIRLRAEGKSYRKIAEELHISRSTCSEWEAQLKEEIAALKHEQLTDLYEAYYMTKRARIERLGGTLQRINDTLANVDLTAMEPKDLMAYQLKYMEALREEYTGQEEPLKLPASVTLPDIVNAMGDLLNRIREGEITTAQAHKEGLLLGNLLKAYDTVEIQTKLDALEAVIGGRR